MTTMTAEAGPEAVRPIDGTTWHLADSLLPVTLCGETIYYGSRRLRTWHETPEEEHDAQFCWASLGIDQA